MGVAAANRYTSSKLSTSLTQRIMASSSALAFPLADTRAPLQ